MAQIHNDEAAALDLIIVEIKEASQRCHVTHQPEAQWLVEFCCNVVRAIATFRKRTANMIDGSRLRDAGGAAMLQLMLRRAVTYLEGRSNTAVVKAGIRHALCVNDDDDFTSLSLQDLKNLADSAVVRRYIEPVVNSVECEMKSAQVGSPYHLRERSVNVVKLLHAIRSLDNTLNLGWGTMEGYRKRLEDKSEMDEMSEKLIEMLKFQKLLAQQIENLWEEVNAGRIRQENGVCPRVFFIVPIDKKKLSTLECVANFNLFTKKMHLYFMCSMFLKELHSAMQTRKGNKTPLAPVAIKNQCPLHEYSAPLEIEQPRDFVKKWGPAVKLSLKVVNILVHAAAFGFGAGTLIPNLNLAEHEKLFDVLQKDLEAMEKETGDTGLPEQATKSVPLSSALDSMVLNDPSHAAVQGYLEVHHKQHWEAKVKANLNVARVRDLTVQIGLSQATRAARALPLDKCGFVYVCKDTPGHQPRYTSSCGDRSITPKLRVVALSILLLLLIWLSWVYEGIKASCNIIRASPKGKTTHADIVKDKVSDCLRANCDGDIVKRDANLAGCTKYESTGCRTQVNFTSGSAPCKSCGVDITAGHPCLVIPYPEATVNKAETKAAYINQHLHFDQCIGKEIPIGEGKKAFALVTKVSDDDNRIGELCVKCNKPILRSDHIIRTWNDPPLHGKCGKDLFKTYVNSFVERQQLDGVPSNAATTDDFSFD